MSDHRPDATALETLQSLIVAFVLAMIFRGFVIEGFVIPTGSMAPTLMGQHVDLHSDATGYDFAAGVDNARLGNVSRNVYDPMIGLERPIGTLPASARPRMGDRILVLKSLYPFLQPKRFDVVVFKNPTNPFGDAGNYIKRLVGLPDETVWLADGDVFVKARNESDFTVRRKPEHIQRAVWHPVYHSDSYVMRESKLASYPGPPWAGESWNTDGRSFRTEDDGPTTLTWRESVRPITDWTPYNQIQYGDRDNERPVSDVRIAAGVVAESGRFSTQFELHARSHVFVFALDAEQATVGYRAVDAAEPDAWIEHAMAPIELPEPGKVFDLELWHADQALRIFIDGEEVVALEYEWSAADRIRRATGQLEVEDVGELIDWQHREMKTLAPSIEWHFAGSPVTLHRVQLDRDLFYRAAIVPNQRHNPSAPGFEDLVQPGTPAFGTHPDKLAVLGPDHYMMLGDNSPASLDSRLWGAPAAEVAAQIDPAPFIVHRRLLMGKAWVVYFPAPVPLMDDGPAVVPNFGELRFIR